MGNVRRMNALTREESLRLLGTVSLGRVVFTHLALPAIRLVHHLVEDDQVIIRTNLGSVIAAMSGPDADTVVAYEADMLDPVGHLGWGVTVVGRARLLASDGEGTRYLDLLPSWVTGSPADIVAIQADVVDGYRLLPGTG